MRLLALLRFQIGFVRRFLWRGHVVRMALPATISLSRSVCRARTFVGQDSNLVVCRIPYDTLEILFHALTQCQRWHRLAAFIFIAATQVHLAQASHHVALATCLPP